MRGVPEASCNNVALLGGARGFCPALGVTSTCAVPPGPAAQTRGALGGLPPERGRHGRHERGRRDGKKSGGRRSLRETAAAFVDDDDEDAPVTAVTVKISAARFGDPSALDDPWSRLGGSDSKKITRVDPESPAFECASSRACAPGLGGERTESFLCQPLTFVSCAWSDELCDQRSTRDATRRATKAPTADDHLTKNVALRLTEPSVSTYLGAQSGQRRGDHRAPARAAGIRAHRPRPATAAFAAAATAMLAGVRQAGARRRAAGGAPAQARALPRGGWRDDRAARGGE